MHSRCPRNNLWGLSRCRAHQRDCSWHFCVCGKELRQMLIYLSKEGAGIHQQRPRVRWRSKSYELLNLYVALQGQSLSQFYTRRRHREVVVDCRAYTAQYTNSVSTQSVGHDEMEAQQCCSRTHTARRGWGHKSYRLVGPQSPYLRDSPKKKNTPLTQNEVDDEKRGNKEQT